MFWQIADHSGVFCINLSMEGARRQLDVVFDFLLQILVSLSVEIFDRALVHLLCGDVENESHGEIYDDDDAVLATD